MKKTKETKILLIALSMILIFFVWTQIKPSDEEKQLSLLKADLKENKLALYNRIDEAVENDLYEEALNILAKYNSLNDGELNKRRAIIQNKFEEHKAKREEKIKSLLKTAQNIPENNYEENIRIYKKLFDLIPSDAPEIQEIEEKLSFYNKKQYEKKEAEGSRNLTQLRLKLSQLRSKKDKVENITWYYDKSSPQRGGTNAFYLYFARKDSSFYPLRLKIRYSSDSWLFIHSYMIVVDGKKYPKRYEEFERDHYDVIWEWTDMPLTDGDQEMIKSIINSKETIIRFYGNQYHDDRTITSQQKKALKNIFEIYNSVK